MASLSPDTDTSVTDLSISRQRIYVRTATRNRYQKPVIKDTGWDLVNYEQLGEGFEPGNDNFEQRTDSKVGNLQYTGIYWMDHTDPIADRLLKSGGRGAFVPNA